ncbi:MAG TPA: VOC family protein [Acidimicrobiales bacterium]|nr:VOC family protein [Acidimicrobiales bacterium]
MLRLRQVVVAARDLGATRTRIEDDLGLPHVWADPGVGYFGLRNALYAVGDCFLEVVSPVKGDAPAARFLERCGHDAGYMVIVQTTDALDDVRTRADDLGIRIVFTADGEGVTGIHFHPADTEGALLSIDRCTVDAAWPWAGPAWEAAPARGYRGLRRATIAVDDPKTVAGRWAELLGTSADGASIALRDSALEFVDGDSGLCAVDLAGPAHAPVEIAGVTFSSSE